MKIAILGCGAYGLALSEMFSQNDCEITMWTKFDTELEDLQKNKTNTKVLPNFKMNSKIKRGVSNE